jgi:hypothetical protein
MMKKIIFSILFFIFVFLFLLSSTLPASAHGGEPRLEISLERINPGGVLELRGVEFDYDEPVALSLLRAEIQIPLMDVTADAEGIFTQVVVLPADLPLGEYVFRAKSDHHEVTSPVFIVWGAPFLDKQENGVRDQSDLELGPLPTFAPASVPEKVPQSAAPEPSVAKSNPTTLIVSLIVGALLLALLGLRLFRKQRL